MLILTIRTDNPEAEVGLYDSQRQLAYHTWHAHKELSVTIHQTMQAVLDTAGKTLDDLDGIVGFAGPGSFTGLRIGLTVANALAYGLAIPVVATDGDSWIQQGIERLVAGEYDAMALPVYGQDAHITLPKK